MRIPYRTITLEPLRVGAMFDDRPPFMPTNAVYGAYTPWKSPSRRSVYVFWDAEGQYLGEFSNDAVSQPGMASDWTPDRPGHIDPDTAWQARSPAAVRLRLPMNSSAR